MTSLMALTQRKKLRKLLKAVREIDESEKIKIGFSSVIYRKDKDLEDERNEVSMKLKKYCDGKGFVFIENANINESALNNSKLHLSKKETNILTQNIISFAALRDTHIKLISLTLICLKTKIR